MEEYKDMVNKLFSKKSPDLIYNSSVNHAKFLINKLFESAQNYIRLYTSGEDISFYKENGVNKIVSDKPEVKMDIIIDTDCNKDEYRQLFPNAKIFCIKKEEKPFNITLPDQMPDPEYSLIKHFITIDEEAYRVERPHDPGSNNVEAVGCACNNILTKDLNNIFDIIKKDLCAPD